MRRGVADHTPVNDELNCRRDARKKRGVGEVHDHPVDQHTPVGAA
jgi:hypothetical protein